MNSRSELRDQMRRARQELSPDLQSASAERLAKHLSEHLIFQRSNRIACYLAVNGEMDLSPVMRYAVAAGKALYLPVLVASGQNRLWFAPYQPGDPLIPNRFGILEPDVARTQMLNPSSLDLVLVPLVAFDAHGNRIGMGGGFYDRTFAFRKRRVNWKRPHLLGVAYAFQQVADLEPEDWDVPLDGVATDQALILPLDTSR